MYLAKIRLKKRKKERKRIGRIKAGETIPREGNQRTAAALTLNLIETVNSTRRGVEDFYGATAGIMRRQRSIKFWLAVSS